jgi:biopolymer transport protein ExbD
MVPMIDMIFLLLIFFLVAAKFRPEEDFLPLQMPAGAGQEQRTSKPEPLVINISPTQLGHHVGYPTVAGCTVQIGTFAAVAIGEESIDEDLIILTEKVRDCLDAQKRFASDPVEIVCAPAVKWEYVARIYNMLYGAGLTDITFAMTE